MGLMSNFSIAIVLCRFRAPDPENILFLCHSFSEGSPLHTVYVAQSFSEGLANDHCHARFKDMEGAHDL